MGRRRRRRLQKRAQTKMASLKVQSKFSSLLPLQQQRARPPQR
jgi:hypothetical protein